MNKLYQSDIYMNDLKVTYNAVPGISALQGHSILVTGATGMIGSYIIDTLAEYNKIADNKITLIAAGRDISRLEARFDGISDSNLLFAHHDNMEKIGDLHAPDYIIHAAGNSFPAAFREDPVGIISGAVTGTKNLLDYARTYENFKRFLYVSSGEVYSDIDTMNSRSCYPISKKACESLCSSYTSQYDIDTVVVRPCHTFGPNMHPSDNKATAQFFNDVINHKDIKLKSAGLQLRSYNYISDTVSGLLTVLINGNTSEAYDLCSKDNTITIANLAEKIAEAGGQKVVFENPSDIALSEQSPITKQVLNGQNLYLLKWIPHFPLNNSIKHVIDILSI